MSVLRIEKRDKNFLILDKTCLNTSKLSWGAKGLHSYLMSLPCDWKVKISDLKNRSTNGRDAVRALINELEQEGYIRKAFVRDKTKGQFLGIEYLVHELPHQNHLIAERPAPGNPSPVPPASENTTLININHTKDPISKKTASAKSQPAAAVADLLIGEIITSNQRLRIDSLIQTLVAHIQIPDPKKLYQEIEHCLLNKKHFTACGQDFVKKLNAIRVVIQRGDWQTPVDMLLQEKHHALNESRKYNDVLQEARAELSHFERLLLSAKEGARNHIETILVNVQERIRQLEHA